MKTSGRKARLAERTEHLTKHFGSVVGLEDLGLEVNAGEVVGYLGPNGADKTPRSWTSAAYRSRTTPGPRVAASASPAGR